MAGNVSHAVPQQRGTTVRQNKLENEIKHPHREERPGSVGFGTQSDFVQQIQNTVGNRAAVQTLRSSSQPTLPAQPIIQRSWLDDALGMISGGGGEGLWDSASGAAGSAVDMLQNGVGEVGSMAGQAWDAASGAAGQASDLASQGMDWLWNTGTRGAENLWNRATNTAGRVSNAASRGVDLASQGMDWLWNTGTRGAENLWNTASNAVGEANNLASSGASTIWNWIQGGVGNSGLGQPFDIRSLFG